MNGTRSSKRLSDSTPGIYVSKKPRSLLESLECKLCRSWLVPPIRSCVNGHNVCSECWRRLQSGGGSQACGECRHQDGYITRCRSLDTVVRTIMSDCTHKCGKRLPISDIDMHHENCSVRPLICPFECSTKVNWPDVPNHFIDHHNMQDIGRCGNFKSSARLIRGNSDALVTRNIYMLKHDGDQFFVRHDILESGVCINIYSAKEYKSEVSADITVQGTHLTSRAKFSVVVGTLREPVLGPNKMILSLETLIGWCGHEAEQTWKVEIEIYMED